MTSPFAASAANYRERGLAVMPCGPGTKFPGRFSASEGWATAYDWQKYCDRLPNERFEMGIWEQWPDAGICLALGRSSAPAGMQLVAMDIDTDDPAEVAAIRAALPGSPVSKRGAKGSTEFYLAPTDVPNRPYNDAHKRRMLDLLAHGRQTVLPPTVHPDCPHCGARGAVKGADRACGDCGAEGLAYRWLTLDTLENFDVADLPVLSVDIADRLSEALAPFGHVDAPKLADGAADPEAEASTHRQLNDTALGNLAGWVPSLSLYKCRQVGGKYKAVSHWRPSSSGRPLSARATNLAIAPEGIKDCGDGRGYTPLDLVMAACGASLDDAFRWLQERVAPAAPIILSAKVPPAEAAASLPAIVTPARANLASLRLATFDGVPVQPCAVEMVVDRPAAAKSPAGIIPAQMAGNLALVDADPEPQKAPASFDLSTEPGLLGDIARFAFAYAYRPIAEFAQLAALAALAPVFARRFATPTGLGLNLYLVGLATTGSGKEALLGAPQAVLRAADVGYLNGASDFTSDSAIEVALRNRPNFLAPIDEIGEFIGAAQHRQAAPYSRTIRKALLDLHGKSSPGSVWTGKQKADVELDKASEPVFSPSLSILGASTEEGFFGALTEANLADGFINRLVVVQGGKAVGHNFDPGRLKVPAALAAAVKDAYAASCAGNLSGATSRQASSDPVMRFVPWGAGALESWLKIQYWQDAAEDEGRAGITGRAAAHVQRIATIRALAREPISPAVSVVDVAWAWELVERSIATVERGARENMSGSEFESLVKAIEQVAIKAGPKGIAWSKLNEARGVARHQPQMVEAALKRLEQTERVTAGITTGPQGGRPGRRVRSTQFDQI